MKNTEEESSGTKGKDKQASAKGSKKPVEKSSKKGAKSTSSPTKKQKVDHDESSKEKSKKQSSKPEAKGSKEKGYYSHSQLLLKLSLVQFLFLKFSHFEARCFTIFTYYHGLDIGKATKKGKAEPTREEMLAVVSNILKEVDFNTVR